MTLVEEALLKEMNNNLFQEVVSDDFSFIDSLVDEDDEEEDEEYEEACQESVREMVSCIDEGAIEAAVSGLFIAAVWAVIGVGLVGPEVKWIRNSDFRKQTAIVKEFILSDDETPMEYQKDTRLLVDSISHVWTTAIRSRKLMDKARKEVSSGKHNHYSFTIYTTSNSENLGDLTVFSRSFNDLMRAIENCGYTFNTALSFGSCRGAWKLGAKDTIYIVIINTSANPIGMADARVWIHSCCIKKTPDSLAICNGSYK